MTEAGPKTPRIEWGVYAFVLALHLGLSWFSPNLAWPDEIYQTLEQGHRLAFGYGTLPWEFRDGVRNFLVPWLLGGWMKLWSPGEASSSLPFMLPITVLLSLFSLAPVWVAISWARLEAHASPWLSGLLVGLWFELVFFAGKSLTEVLAGYALCVALLHLVRAGRSGFPHALAWAGAYLSLVVGLRLQLLPVAAVLFLFVAIQHRPRLASFSVGGALVLVGFGVADALAWGTPFLSYWNYFRVNFFEGKAASFGVSPWFEYLASLAEVWHVAGLFLLGLSGRVLKQGWLFGLSALVVLVSHSLIAHKEYRFLAPMLFLFIVLAAHGASTLHTSHRRQGVVVALVWALLSLWRGMEYRWESLAPRTQGARATPVWTLRRGEIKLYQSLSRKASVCGVGLVGIHWAWSPGYTWLHRNVPIVMATQPGAVAQHRPLFNFALAPLDLEIWLPGFRRAECAEGLCLFQREGDCQNPFGYDFNRWLEANRM